MAENKTVLREAANNVVIEGIVSEIRIEETTVNDKQAISGEIDIMTDENSVHTVKVFSYKHKKDGTENGIYKGLETVMNEYKSVASHGKEEADKVRVTGAKLGLNEYYGQDGQLKSYPQIQTNFINRLKPNEEFNPRAEFEVELFITNVSDELKNNEETGRAVVKGIIPLYEGKVIPFQFVVTPEGSSFVKDNYEVGTTVKVYGDIVNSVHKQVIVEEVAFGKPKEKIKSTTVREFLITGGTDPYDTDDSKAYDKEVIKKALVERETYLEELKKKKDSANNSKTEKKGGFDTKADKPSKPKAANDLPF